MLHKLALTCVMLITGQAPAPEMHYTNLREGQIPFSVPPTRRDEYQRLELYISADRGYSWDLMDSIAPDKEGFSYHVAKDGEYWFQVAVITKQGKREPEKENFSRVPAKLKTVVDTTPPTLKITAAQRVGDELAVSWVVDETNPDPQTLKMEYRTSDSPAWIPIVFTPDATGTAKTHLTGSAPVVVRMQFKDLAGNPAQVEAAVGTGVATASYNPGVTAVGATTPQPVLNPGDGVLPPPAVVEKHVAVTPPAVDTPGTPIGVLPQATGNSGSGQVVASSADKSQGSVVAPAPAVPVPGKRTLPELQIVNDCEILLEYKVSKVGPSGIGTVEVWMTRDGGKSWAKFAYDEDAPHATNDGVYQRTLKLPGDGVYGISLVVKNKAGIGKPAPRPGEVPEMLVEVDTIAPDAKLLLPIADPARRDTLILSWTAEDRNLGPKAITLEWAEQPQGPWRPIAADLPALPNRYPWVLPASMPSHVYLRLTVRDTAGNSAVAVTAEPQLVDMSEPEGRLIRVAPANKKN